jgi:hypothetical protein
MKDTIKLLRIIGSPFIPETNCVEPPEEKNEILNLYNCAKKNRMPLLYLIALKKWNKLGNLREKYEVMYKRSLMTYTAISKASKVLQKEDIKHALFKTIRPYPATTIDIDIIIFDSQEYNKSIEAMINVNYKKLGSGPNSTTVQDQDIRMGVDLYKEIAVSQIIYLNKKNINSYILKNKITDTNESVNNLSPSADLIALIAHSIFKEQMHTLSEYYSTLYFLAQMNSNEIENFLSMIHENAIVKAAQIHLGITAELHKLAHNMLPEKLKKIIRNLKVDAFESKRLENSVTPHKFHILTIAKAFSEKIRKEEKIRTSIPKQFLSMFNPDFTSDVIKRVVNNITRKTY